MNPLFERGDWERIGPWLDELLGLEASARGARLATLAQEDPALARELESLLEDGSRAASARFLEPASESLAGARVGAYVLEAPLGAGGTGAVWRARRADGRYEGAVAVKLLHLSLMGRSGAARFEREGAILARLSHPHIARLLDAGVIAGGQPYLVLELVEGERIDQHCDGRRLDLDARVALFMHVLDAVAHAHRHLVIHRDLKPANILVTPDGSVKLLDFGIAKLVEDETGSAHATALTREGGRALTPWYAAPEQLRDDVVTTATDVYALGVVLYELLAGRHPTHDASSTIADGIRATLELEPSPMSQSVAPAEGDGTVATARATTPRSLRVRLRGDLDNIVAKALRKAPAERYPSVDALADDLRAWCDGRPVAARPRSMAYVTSRFVSRHRAGVAAAALLAVAIAGGVAGTVTEARRADAQRLLAEQAADVARRERDGALEQQRLLRGTSEFMQLLLRDAQQGDPSAVRRQLDRARELIARTRFEHPIVKVALLRQTAARFVEVGDLATAVVLLREALATVDGTDLAAPTSGVPVNLACSMANLLHELGDDAGALASLDRADRLSAAGAQLSPPSRVECRSVRATVEAAIGRYEHAIALAREALRMLDEAGIRDGEQRRVVRSTLASTLMSAGRHADAMTEAAPLLRESEAGQGRGSLGVLWRSNNVTTLTRLGGDPLAALARSDADRADAARIVGGSGLCEIDLEHARILLALDRGAEALPYFVQAVEGATRAQQRAVRFSAELGRVQALLTAGRVAEALHRFDGLAAEREAAERGGGRVALDATLVAALVSVTRDRADDARRAWRMAMERVDAAGGMPWSAAYEVAIARAEFEASHDRGAAAVEAQRALEAARRTALDPDRSADVGRAQLLLASLALARGDAAGARTQAAHAATALEATLGPSHPATRRARALGSLPADAPGAIASLR